MQKGKTLQQQTRRKGKQNDSKKPTEDNNPYILYIWITNIDRG
jgi:hypothetical protein